MNQINEEEIGGEVTVGAGVGDVDWRLVMWLGLDEVTRGRLRFLRVVEDRLLVRFVSRVYEPGRDWLERTRGLYPGVEFLEVL